jgi:hypothetical protein
VAFELADLPGHPARAIARKHKAVIEQGIAELLARGGLPEPKEHAQQIYSLVEGAAALILIHGDVRYAASAATAGKSIVRAAEEKRIRALTAGSVDGHVSLTSSTSPAPAVK